MPPSNRHLIIAGTNKSGTTSLFRYLADHPDICGCDKKELGYFLNLPDKEATALYDGYISHFKNIENGDKILLEATPNYIDGGHTIAKRISDLLPDPQLVFMLRNPIDRLVSYYKSKQGLTTSVAHGLALDDFARKALTLAQNEKPADADRDRLLAWQIEKSKYALLLEQYLEVFPASSLAVYFFEDFQVNPLQTVQSICKRLGIDDSFYDTYTFHIENRSRHHKNSRLRTTASHVNRDLEKYLNRVPGLRRYLRGIYNYLNTKPGKTYKLDPELSAEILAFLEADNHRLATLLGEKFDITTFPKWLVG